MVYLLFNSKSSGIYAERYENESVLSEKKQLFDKVSMAVSLIGGAAGTALAIALTDRKITKENVWLRIWTICILLIQIFVFLLLKMSSGRTISFNIWGFLKNTEAFFIIWRS